MIDFLQPIREKIFNHFWDSYRAERPEVRRLEADLARQGKTWIHDHHAFLDLPGPVSGIHTLRQVFEPLGYVQQGSGHIPQKQNNFAWFAPIENLTARPSDSSSQIVLSDFELSKCSRIVQMTVQKYSEQANAAPIEEIQRLADLVKRGELQYAVNLSNIVIQYLESKPWPLPTVRDFETIHHENELLAWTLVFGRKVNHFTLAAHLVGGFQSLEQFNDYAVKDMGFHFNSVAGAIKGNPEERLEQSSSLHFRERVRLQDGEVQLPGSFIEFVWRHPKDLETVPTKWIEYFNGFISKNANNVVESLIESSSEVVA